jgi:hypothetical protein
MKMSKLLLNLCSAEKYDGYFVFWSMNINRLMKYDIKTTEMRELDCSKLDELRPTSFLFNSSTLLGKKVYLAPYNSNCVCVYDFESDEVDVIPINQAGKCSDIFHIDNDLILWGWGENNVRRLNINDNKIYSFDGMKNIKVSSNPIMINNTLLFTVNEENTICEYLLGENRCIKHKVGVSKQLFNTISYDDGHIWLTGDENIVVKWNKSNGTIHEITLSGLAYGSRQNGTDFLFSNSKICGEYIYLSPYKSDNFIRIKCASGECEILGNYKESTGGFFVEIDTHQICLVVETGRHQASRNVLINDNGELCEEKIFFVSSSSEIALNYIKTELLYESVNLELFDFIDML